MTHAMVIAILIQLVFLFILFALAVALSTAMQNGIIDRAEDTFYKCKHNPIPACKGYCCKFCEGASECKYACQGRPDECGLSERMDKLI